MKQLIVLTFGRVFDYFWTKAERLRSLVKKLKMEHGSNFELVNPRFIMICAKIRIGDRTLINSGVTILAYAPITIGDEVMIGPNVNLFTSGHDPDLSGLESREAVVTGAIQIESGVWIGGATTILPGVTIGRRSVIGAGSVVTRDIPADSIAVGNPCRVIRKKSILDVHHEKN
jgi:maltose O-acetyltransferase